MTTKFDLEKAKAGAPIEYQEAYGWTEIPFIGAWTNPDYVVCEVPWSDKPECVPLGKLRMAKKKEVLLCRLCVLMDLADTQKPLIHAATKRHFNYEGLANFVRWLTDWQEYEIGENDE